MARLACYKRRMIPCRHCGKTPEALPHGGRWELRHDCEKWGVTLYRDSLVKLAQAWRAANL